MIEIGGKKKLRHKAFDEIMKLIKAGVSPLMIGPGGSGKTTIAKEIAEALGLDFYYTGSVESAFQLKGFVDGNGNVVRTPFRDAYENGGLFVFDELDSSDPQALVSLHAALDNGFLDAPDGIIEQHPDFRYMATANTWGTGASLEYMGRNALDGATLDRYVPTTVDYDKRLEKEIVKRFAGKAHLDWVEVVHKARQAVREMELHHIVSTRAIVNGAKLRNAGFSIDDTFKRTIAKGLPEDEVLQLTEHMDRIVSPTHELDEEHTIDIRKRLESIAAKAEKLSGVERELSELNDHAENITQSVTEQIERLKAELLTAQDRARDAQKAVKHGRAVNDEDPIKKVLVTRKPTDIFSR